MSYISPGWHYRQTGDWLVKLCQRIKDSAGGGVGWEANIGPALMGTQANIHPNKRLNELVPEMLIQIVGSPKFPIGSTALVDLQQLVFWLLKQIGAFKTAPEVLTFIGRPELSLDDVVDRIVSTKIKPIQADEMPGEPKFGVFVTLIPGFIRHVLRENEKRPHYVRCLRAAACHIGNKLYKGETLTAAEKTLFLHLAPAGTRAFTAEELAPNGSLVAGTSLKPAHCNDSEVFDVFKLYSAVVELGPWSDFIYCTSDMESTQLAVHFGPKPAPLPIFTGYRETRSAFSMLELVQTMTLPCSDATQLEALRERSTALVSDVGINPFMLTPPVTMAPIADGYFPTSLDIVEPSLTLEYDRTVFNAPLPALGSFEVTWFNPLVSRRESTYTPQHTFQGASMIAYARLYSKQSFGSGRVSALQLGDIKVIWLSECRGLATSVADAEKGGPALIETDDVDIRVLYPNARTRTVASQTVNCSPLFYRGGLLFVLPGFRDYMYAPSGWAFEEAPEAMAYLLSRLALNPEQERLSRAALLVSWNIERLSLFLGEQQRPRVSAALTALAALIH